MTIIAYRDGILCADSQAQTAGDVRMGALSKIFDMTADFGLEPGHRFAGALAAICGYAPFATEVLDWIKRDCPGPQPVSPDDAEYGATVIVFSAAGPITIYERGLSQAEAAGPFLAYGSGMEVAMGAMWMGASARKAVECAIALVTTCGGEIRELRRR